MEGLPSCLRGFGIPLKACFSTVKEGEEAEEEDAAGAAVSDGGYESDNDDTDANVQMRAESNGHVAAAVIALAAASDGCAAAFCIEGMPVLR